jgi:hypothetical protein
VVGDQDHRAVELARVRVSLLRGATPQLIAHTQQRSGQRLCVFDWEFSEDFLRKIVDVAAVRFGIQARKPLKRRHAAANGRGSFRLSAKRQRRDQRRPELRRAAWGHGGAGRPLPSKPIGGPVTTEQPDGSRAVDRVE